MALECGFSLELIKKELSFKIPRSSSLLLNKIFVFKSKPLGEGLKTETFYIFCICFQLYFCQELPHCLDPVPTGVSPFYFSKN